MLEFAAVSSFIGAIAFAFLCTLLFGGQRDSLIGRLLLLAGVMSTVWLLSIAAYYQDDIGLDLKLVFSLEIFRHVGWFTLFAAILLAMDSAPLRRPIFRLTALAYIVAAAALIVVHTQTISSPDGDAISLAKLVYVLFLVMPILGLLFVEQLYRNTHPDSRWGIKHLCVGLLGLYAYDIYLFAEGVLFTRLSSEAWAARGLVNAMAVPLIALSAKRNTSWDVNVFVSRKIVFYSASILAVGAYLLFVASAGYYLKSYGGSWGGALRTALFFGATLVLLTLIVSTQARSRLRLFLAKHFYENKYEYGDVWLNLTDQLSSHGGSAEALYSATIKAVAEILDCTGGALWYRDRDGDFTLGANWVFAGDYPAHIDGKESFIAALERDCQTVDLHNVAATYDSGDAAVPRFILDLPRAWLIVPIIHADSLVAFMIVAESRTSDSISWEDRDLLNTVGRQIGSYIALINTTIALTELRQFEAFNQLSAFLVHDLKNVVAQLSLVVRNSEKYRDNPEFIADSFTTISDAVNKMNRMLASLKQSQAVGREAEQVELVRGVSKAVARCQDKHPRPQLSEPDDDILVLGNEDAIVSVVQHLVQNAQDATPDTGQIEISISADDDVVQVEITDNGCGMDEAFINTRLFKPFDTTKGKAGMGIGVYESRQLVTQMGGKLTVESTPGVGTRFTISLPRVAQAMTENTYAIASKS